MNGGRKNLPRISAGFLLGFALACLCLLPCSAMGSTADSTMKREAASSQFARAEELRAMLNSKAPEQRSLAEYRKVVAGYQRVYLITPRATEVPEALLAVAELNIEMGDRFGRSYYQAAADSYAFLIREYPKSKYTPDAMLRLAKLQKDQLEDLSGSTKTYQDFAKRYPRSKHKREVQEALAELALRRSAESGEAIAKLAPVPAPSPAPATPVKSEVGVSEGRKATSGGEPSKTVAVPRVQRIRTSATADRTEVIIELEDSVQYAAGRIANPDRIYIDLHAAQLSPLVARGKVRVSGGLLTQVRAAQNHSGVVRVVLDVNGVKEYAVSLSKKPARLIIELYSATSQPKTASAETGKATKSTESEGKEVPVEDVQVASKPAAPETIPVTSPAVKPPGGPEPSKG